MQIKAQYAAGPKSSKGAHRCTSQEDFDTANLCKQASDAAARRKAQQEQNRRRQSDFLRNAFFGQQFGQQKQRAPGPSESANRRKYDDSDGGHVIDVEATTIDEH